MRREEKEEEDQMEQKRPLIIITGPTASGKTALSIELAKRISGEIISADSMQVYRHMDIGSAKVTREEMDGVPHYLIDVLDPPEEFNVVRFQEMAKQAMEEIYSHGNIPIIAGGTGFYIQALLYDIDFTETDEDSELRKELEKKARTDGPAALHALLEEIDPESAEAIHENNVKRVIRAIEFYRQTGMKISEHNRKEREKTSPYQFLYYVLDLPRPLLYSRIDERVDRMMEHGLVEEVKALQAMGCTRDMVSMQGLGYKEILDYLNGQLTLDEAVYILKRDTRHFAKRQLTWFRRERNVRWLESESFKGSREKMLHAVLEDCRKAFGEKFLQGQEVYRD